MKWLARARAEISKSADRGTANTDETGLLSVLAVGHSQVSGERPAADPRRAERQRRAVELLREHPARRRAVVADGDTRGDAVVVTVAVRGRDGQIAVSDLLIPSSRYDPFAIIAALEASEQ